jgi:hypothetical protein
MAICLNMIVKDESANLPRLFASVAGVADCFVVSDTGSGDGTPDLLDRLSDRYGIPGIVATHPWVDFSTNRNIALKAALEARRAGDIRFDWLMVIDADEELLVKDPAWRGKLTPGSSHVAYKRGASISFQHDLLLWAEGQDWAWEGGVHAYVRNAVRGHRIAHTNSLAVKYGDFIGAKTRSFANPQEKAQADLSNLKSELEGKSPGPDNAHRFFQLGYAYRNTGDFADCARTMLSVADCQDTSSELSYAALVVAGQTIGDVPGQGSEAMRCFERAMRVDGDRWEAPYHMAVGLRRKRESGRAREMLESRLERGFSDVGLYWKEHPVYEWRLAYDLCFLRSLTGDRQASACLAEELLATGGLPGMEEGFLRQLLKLPTDGASDCSPDGGMEDGNPMGR